MAQGLGAIAPGRDLGVNKWRMESEERRVSGTGKRTIRWLHSLNDCTKIDKVLNVSIK